jgi:hypothetical protein
MANQAGIGHMMYRQWLIGGLITLKDGNGEKKGRILDLEVNGRMLIWTREGLIITLRYGKRRSSRIV